MSHPGVIVPVGIAVTAHLPPDDGSVAPDLIADIGTAQTGVAAPHDRDPLIETESMPAAAWPAHIAGIGDSTPSVTPHQFHRSSLAPPVRRSPPRHAQILGRPPQRHTLANLIEQSPPRRS
jgi:hypothetical protein